MGVSSLVNDEFYVGDGMSTAFSFPFYFFNLTDLQVYLYDTILGGITQQILNTNYTITASLVNSVYPSGGTINFTSAPPSTSYVIISRQPPEVQNFALGTNGLIPSLGLTQQFDYLTLQVQALQSQINRCVQVPQGTNGIPGFSAQLPQGMSLNPGAGLVVNQSGNGFGFAGVTPSFPVIQSFQVPFTAVQTAANNVAIPIFTIPPSCILQFLAVKHTTLFSGGSISDAYVNIGLSSDYSQFINDFDIHQAVGDQTYDDVSLNNILSFANSTIIYLQAVSIGANLSALTQGNLTVWCQYTTL